MPITGVTAKFKCSAITDGPEGSEYKTVTLYQVYSSDPERENYSWSKATPSGTVTMNITNPAAFGWFEVGAEYFIDFTKDDPNGQ